MESNNESGSLQLSEESLCVTEFREWAATQIKNLTVDLKTQMEARSGIKFLIDKLKAILIKTIEEYAQERIIQ
jgi:hypothetical protein